MVVESDADDDEIDEIASFIADAEKSVDLLRDQQAKGNRRFLRKAMETPGRGVQSLVQEVSSLDLQNSMPQTWKRRKNAASMYYQPGPRPEDQTLHCLQDKNKEVSLAGASRRGFGGG